ncbi:C-Jun-amino-terminal kinase-interacting protein 1-like [Lethenteron reissneri]|uniref:C-Jun-amino-terminal kinase-interacting protein 1-like n=1 Tax=Lethenteron reissneri TaxID=7753 RepID=UPI002AB783ED|nr:C-Jun-amino-terminal kinase-interacting protein 1-like [Lethenteron reissneri]
MQDANNAVVRLAAHKKRRDWFEIFDLQFLGSVEVPHHQGNDVLYAAMQKVASSRRAVAGLKPTLPCSLEVGARGLRLTVTGARHAPAPQRNGFHKHKPIKNFSHFFQLKNISFCGFHPKNPCYFGFICKHPTDGRFACHVLLSTQSTKPIAECFGKAFQQFYHDCMDYNCPVEDIFLE